MMTTYERLEEIIYHQLARFSTSLDFDASNSAGFTAGLSAGASGWLYSRTAGVLSIKLQRPAA
jgi:hypothetical protein